MLGIAISHFNGVSLTHFQGINIFHYLNRQNFVRQFLTIQHGYFWISLKLLFMQLIPYTAESLSVPLYLSISIFGLYNAECATIEKFRNLVEKISVVTFACIPR